MSGKGLIRLLVCGGRGFDKFDAWNWLEGNAYDYISDKLGINRPRLSCLIQGGTLGADEGAKEWGRSEGLRVITYKADWAMFGKAAGPIRNKRMIVEGKPDIVIAFPGGRGTADMVKQAYDAGIPVVEVRP